MKDTNLDGGVGKHNTDLDTTWWATFVGWSYKFVYRRNFVISKICESSRNGRSGSFNEFCTIWAHTHEEASQSFCIERIIHMFPSHCCCIWQTKTSNCLDFRLNFHNCRPNRRTIRIKSKQSNSCRKPFDRPHSIWSINIALTNHLINLNPFGETMRWRCIFFCDRSIIPSYF